MRLLLAILLTLPAPAMACTMGLSWIAPTHARMVSHCHAAKYRVTSCGASASMSGAASATGDQGAASATGYQGAASATGYQGAASATGYHSVACGLGHESKAMAGETGAIVLVNRNGEGEIVAISASKVGENGIKPNTWYTLNAGGGFIEVSDE